MAEQQTVQEGRNDFDLMDSAWGKLIVGGAMIWLGFYCDSLFTALETGERESARINWIIALAYESLGHELAVWSIWVGGGLALLFGVKQLFSDR